MLRTDARRDAHTDGQCENSIPTENKVFGGYNNILDGSEIQQDQTRDYIVAFERLKNICIML